MLQKRLEDMFQLLSLWTQYIEVIYMPESEIHVISAIEKMEARPEDTAYGVKAQESDVKHRIHTLFSDEKREGDEDDLEEQMKEDYETVNEGMTTDTTEAPQAAVRRGEFAEATADSAKGAEAESGVQEEGILSSDEEETATAAPSEKAIK